MQNQWKWNGSIDTLTSMSIDEKENSVCTPTTGDGKVGGLMICRLLYFGHIKYLND